MVMADTIKQVRKAVLEALHSLDSTRRTCIAAGQLLVETKARLSRPRNGGRYEEWEEGDGFEEWIEKNIPEIHVDTARRWMRAARGAVKGLPGIGDGRFKISEGDVIDIEGVPVSEVLATPDEALSAGARQWKQAWLDFTEHKTIKECMAGVLIDGDPDHRMDRAINGKMARGAGGSGDRKDYSFFTFRKLRHLNTFFSSWETMTELQRTEIKDMFAAAVTGAEFHLRHSQAKLDQEFTPWPKDLVRVLKEAVGQRLKAEG